MLSTPQDCCKLLLPVAPPVGLVVSVTDTGCSESPLAIMYRRSVAFLVDSFTASAICSPGGVVGEYKVIVSPDDRQSSIVKSLSDC